MGRKNKRDERQPPHNELNVNKLMRELSSMRYRDKPYIQKLGRHVCRPEDMDGHVNGDYRHGTASSGRIYQNEAKTHCRGK